MEELARLPEFASNHWELFVALLLITALLIQNMFGDRLRGYLNIPPAEVTKLINHSNAVLLDVRSDNERDSDGLIPDSLHIPLSELPNKISELDKYTEQPLVIYCRSGARSGSACAKVHKITAREELYSMSGGILAWVSSGLPTSTPSKDKKSRKKSKS